MTIMHNESTAASTDKFIIHMCRCTHNKQITSKMHKTTLEQMIIT